MKFPLDWLKESIALEFSPQQLAEKLTLIGLEVESHKDDLFEISLTPNLSHCMSVYGIARELSALIEKNAKLPQFKIKETGPAIETLVQMDIKDPTSCPRYSCRVITDVTVGPSPQWLQARLEACGIRPVNIVVDCANYVMLELGHPLHAFDLDTLKGSKVVVRRAKKGETLMTLDHKEQFPTEETLLICDQERPQAIAGVIGGKASEVTEKTTRILLEAAYFEPTQVRRTSKRMGIQTEASRRFERGTDPNALLLVLDRAASLIQEIAGGDVAQGTLDVELETFPPKEVSCRVSQVNRLLGTQLGIGEIETIFTRLGLVTQESTQDAIKVSVPTYRRDIEEEIDLVEEVARLYGLDNIPTKPAVRYEGSTLPHNPLYLFERDVRSRLISEGLQEFLTCNLISPSQAALVSLDAVPSRSLIKLLNPSSVDQSILRPSLLPNMLEVVAYNHAHENTSLAGFEVGRVHFKTKERYVEPTIVSLVLTGKRAAPHWEEKNESVDFYDLKGCIENLLHGLQIPPPHFVPSAYENFHPGRQAKILIEKREVGIMGEVHPLTLHKVDIAQPVFFAEINLEDLIDLRQTEVKMSPLSSFPASTRDWTLSLPNETPVQEVLDLIEAEKSLLLESVTILDVYHSEKLGSDLKNVTFRFVYRDPKETISLKTVEQEYQSLTEKVLKKLGKGKKL